MQNISKEKIKDLHNTFIHLSPEEKCGFQKSLNILLSKKNMIEFENLNNSYYESEIDFFNYLSNEENY